MSCDIEMIDNTWSKCVRCDIPISKTDYKNMVCPMKQFF